MNDGSNTAKKKDGKNKKQSTNVNKTSSNSSSTTGGGGDGDDGGDQRDHHHNQEEGDNETAILSQLMTALATGARAVQGLPLDDDFEFQSSFPEVQKLLEETHTSLLDVLVMALGGGSCSGVFGSGGSATTAGGTGTTTTTPSGENAASGAAAAAATTATSSSSGGGGGGGEISNFESIDDPLLWEACSDVCDALLEQAAVTTTTPQLRQELNSAKTQAQKSFGRLLSGIVDMEKPQLNIPGYYDIQNNSTNDSQSNDDDNMEDIVDARRQPFIPKIVKKYHSKVPLDLTLQPGHGLNDRYGSMRKVKINTDNVIVAESHVPHPYQTEIEQLEFSMELYPIPNKKPLAIRGGKGEDSSSSLTATWIDTPDLLKELKSRLDQLKTNIVAIDLEAHSYRSFKGITCLIQMTFDEGNYLIDPFPLWNLLQKALGPTLSNPKIVKVLHGADSDVQWLQRDFGLYVVKLFDTGRAARALNLSSAGYAYLLQHYANLTADKTHQLSDWRQRPLPQSMKEYAIMDTHYLVRILPHILYDLSQSKTTSIQQVFEDSKKVSLFRYSPEPFKPDGYKVLTSRRGTKKNTELNECQENILKALWDWRDQIARQEDESHAYVCTNTQLLRLAMACPSNLGQLQNILQPMPPLILRNSKSILNLIQRHQNINNKIKNVNPPSSAFFKPAITADREVSDSPRDANNRLLSPVLGTEALYRQAGWISPAHNTTSNNSNNPNHGGTPTGDGEAEEVIITTTEDEDDEDQMKDDTANKTSPVKPRRVLAVHETNNKYRTNQFSAHSLQLSSSSRNKDSNSGIIPNNEALSSAAQDEEQSNGLAVDGMETARVVHSSQVNVGGGTTASSTTVEGAARLAKTNAERIRKAQQEHGMGFIPPTATDDMEEDDEDGDADDDDNNDPDDEEDGDTGDNEKSRQELEEFNIPRSMREIYRISNRNRRNKKGGSLSPSAGGGGMGSSSELIEKENRELAKADELLKSRNLEGGGGNYYDEIMNSIGGGGGSPKRQRTKSTTSLSSNEEANPGSGGNDSGNFSRDDDIALMQKIGWISSKEEVDSMMKQQQQQSNTASAAVADGGGGGNDNDDSSADENEAAAVAASSSNKGSTATKSFDYSKVKGIGALSSTPSANPFFAGAAMVGGTLNRQQGGGGGNAGSKQQHHQSGSEKKKQSSNRGGGSGKQKNRQQQVERPERREGRSQVYKKR